MHLKLLLHSAFSSASTVSLRQAPQVLPSPQPRHPNLQAQKLLVARMEGAVCFLGTKRILIPAGRRLNLLCMHELTVLLTAASNSQHAYMLVCRLAATLCCPSAQSCNIPSRQFLWQIDSAILLSVISATGTMLINQCHQGQKGAIAQIAAHHAALLQHNKLCNLRGCACCSL